jgi:hypothetical protein
MVIFIAKLVLSCDSNDQGDVIRKAIVKVLKTKQVVCLDFTGVTNVTSSFVNTALLDLTPDYDLATIKSRVKITKVNRQIGNLIKDRFASEAKMTA